MTYTALVALFLRGSEACSVMHMRVHMHESSPVQHALKMFTGPRMKSHSKGLELSDIEKSILEQQVSCLPALLNCF